MTFTSYAQNFEDVMLWRALKDVSNGFYVDVGANDPTLYSVTRAFYERGWHGINVEPVENFYARLVQERERDINLKVAAGAETGTAMIANVEESGLATLDKPLGEHYTQSGWNVQSEEVQVRPLTEILVEHAQEVIHFLKVDVEGFEEQVLRGMDFRRWRPWIVVIEATKPMSQETNHETWEALVSDFDYEFAYFDGLNRYYVANEHAHLRAAFAVPPNVFDGFVVASDAISRMRADEAEHRAAVARESAINSRNLADAAQNEVSVARAAEATMSALKAQAESLAAEQQRLAAQAQMKVDELTGELSAAELAVRQAQAEAQAQAEKSREAAELARAAEGRATAALAQMAHANARTEGLLASTSWKITAPMRSVVTGSSTLVMRARRIRATPRSLLISVIKRRVAGYVKRTPGAIKAAHYIRVNHPSLFMRLRGLLSGGSMSDSAPMSGARWHAGALPGEAGAVETGWMELEIPAGFVANGTAGLDTDLLTERVVEISASQLRADNPNL